MIKRIASLIIFHDNGRIMFQDRREISKWGEKYGFFGGGVKKGETLEDAIKREMREELNITLKKPRLLRREVVFVEELGGEVDRTIFLSSIPKQRLISNEGDICITKTEEALTLKMIKADTELLRELVNRGIMR